MLFLGLIALNIKYRNPKNDSDSFNMSDCQRKIAAISKGVNKLNDVIDWEMFRKELESLLGYSKRDVSKGGRPPFDPVLMFKILVLQKYYGLSDDQTEFQIKDRFSFMEFLGLQAGDSVPDAKTIWDFKQLLEKDGREGGRKLFENFTQYLESQALIAREGSIIDASFVDAPRQRNSRAENAQIKAGEPPEGFEENTPKGRQKDVDARWVKQNDETHYGYKNHAKVDAKSKLVLDYSSTTATVHDSQVFEQPINEQDPAVFADSAYFSESSLEHLLKNDCQDFILFKASGGNPLSEEELVSNKLRSPIRVRCEHVFGRMSQMAMDKLRSIGLLRANLHIGLSNLVYNMDRYAFLCK